VRRKREAQWIIALFLLGVIQVACGKSLSNPAPTQDAAQTQDSAEWTADMRDPDSYDRIYISEDLYWRRVQPGVFVITHSFPWPGNSMIVEMRISDPVLVDTPYTSEATRELLEWVETKLGER
jgi:hypothetical protein